MPDEHRLTRIDAAGGTTQVARTLADEAPIALEFNGIGYAVLMASATDLEDLVYGFAPSERLVATATEVPDVDIFTREDGTIVRATLGVEAVGRLTDRVRHRTSESSCGMCGTENLE